MQSSNNFSRIIGLQFSTLSPEEIRRASVAQITSNETYINNKPVVGGLFDPRMGVLEQGLICPTDGLDYMQTPGYFGHIELACPVFYVQHLGTIMKLLKCVCFKCSKLLISKEKYKQALDKPNQQRWEYVSELCKNIKRCGQDTDDGCGCIQPKTIKKDGIASLFANWGNVGDNNEDITNFPMYPEFVLKIFKRISDEDVTFMGFSPIWSRPDWFICQVLAVPPPAVRPSVKHDSQQRSEDDLTHILANIIKTNRTLQEKIQNNAPAEIIRDYLTVLQFNIASLVDNNLPGANPIAQRSGRPMKSIKSRLSGKTGRMRGNLMAKRVDYSARSVITADPNISIRELGIPMKIAKNITKPVYVNRLNRDFLTKLVQNGPDVWPGAKVLERQNGTTVTLRYLDRNSILLEYGDIVHRHMMDGDAILFNRQPTLHRMSMMCHIAKIMKQGDTFRMNVADTKPYNADFDGDEMNLHMPQDQEAESELINLAAVPYQIISPANNSPIIGIYQDSMLGSYRFTRKHVDFSQREAMNLLMMFNRINPETLKKPNRGRVTNFEILSQIMPPMTLRTNNKKYMDEKGFSSDKEKAENSNNVIEIINGKYLRGQMDKGILGAGTKGLIHRTCNDFGNMASSQFIDDLQNIITEYMKHSAFSVGISDIITDNKTNDKIMSIISERIKDVNNLIDQVQIGVFENNSGKSNQEEFETKITNILNKAQNDAGREALNSLSDENRFVVMFQSGSKGSEINIQQMTACLGQQSVDNKRIPYGFENRTLPHYKKFDDSAESRGFVSSSYINGLSPQELFFHAMGGRVGLIDTAVKTSTTGYIQRRLIKGLEDLMIHYDMTIRSNKNKIVQFTYGGDGVDPIKVENQDLPIIDMSVQDIYNHFALINETTNTKRMSGMFVKSVYARQKKQTAELNKKCEQYIQFVLQHRKDIVTNVFHNKSNKMVRMPVAFAPIIQNILGQQGINANSLVDLTMLEAFQMIEDAMGKLEMLTFTPPTVLFKILYFYYLSPKDLLMNKRFNKSALTLLLETILLMYKRSIVAPGEMVGMLAAQSIGEPATQMTLNTFHFAGVGSKSNVTRGVPRLEELLTLTVTIKNPSLTIYLKQEDQTNKEKANSVQYLIEHTQLRDVVQNVTISFDPDDLNTLIDDDVQTISQYKEFETMMDECSGQETDDSQYERSKWIIRMEMDIETMLEKNITMDDIHFAMNNSFKDEISCVYSDYNADKLVFRVRMSKIMNNSKKGNGGKKKAVNQLDQSDMIGMIKSLQDKLLDDVILRGQKGINKVILRKVKDNLVEKAGTYTKEDIWVLDTIGTNLLGVLSLDYVDCTKTISNDIMEIFNVLGMEAARQALYNEFVEVLEFNDSYVNTHHLLLLCDRMTSTYKMISIFRHGINNDDIGPIAKASFEETPKIFLNAARHAELDTVRGISSNVMCGQEGMYGTSAFQVVLDINKFIKLEEISAFVHTNEAEQIDKQFQFVNLENETNVCSKTNLQMHTNVANIEKTELGEENNDYDPFN